jgi:hypothetical protein
MAGLKKDLMGGRRFPGTENHCQGRQAFKTASCVPASVSPLLKSTPLFS